MIKDKKYIKQLIAIQQRRDREMAHAEADAVLCKLLRKLGYGDVVDEYHKVDKWYA